MFSHATKEAIKVGLAVGLSIMLAFSFGWEKSYWSVLSVFVVAANDTYAHAINKAGNRILGTLIGVGFAIFLLAMFPQDRLLFILFLSLFLAWCVFVESHKRFGYVFKMGFTVCVIIATVGGFNSDVSFATAVLRTQETILGIVVYSVVFRLIWPRKTEDIFFESLSVCEQYSRDRLRFLKLNEFNLPDHGDERAIDGSMLQLNRLAKLNDILDLSLVDSYHLAQHKTHWRLVVKAHIQLEKLITRSLQEGDVALHLISKGASLLLKNVRAAAGEDNELSEWSLAVDKKWPTLIEPTSAFNLPVKQRLRNTVKAICILWTCLAMWIYMPIPGGYVMPMLGAIFANVLAGAPAKAIKFTAIITTIWGVVFISEYLLIMPHFTEAWQLAGLYFINAFVVWKASEKTGLEIQKVLAGNLSVVFAMGALQLTPSYDAVTPLFMLALLYMVLVVVAFYDKLLVIKQ